MKRFQSFEEAVRCAAEQCAVWRDNQGKAVTVLALIDSIEKNPDLTAPASYMVSEEGALGTTDQYEYRTAWILYPMEDGPEKEKYLREIQQMIDPSAAETASQPAVIYCTNCGKQLDADAKFCSSCGKPQS